MKKLPASSVLWRRKQPVCRKSLRDFGDPRLRGGEVIPAQAGISQVAERGDYYGGTLINIIAGVILVALFGLSLWWVIKGIGQAGQQYGEALVDTRYTAITVRCQTNMRTIWQNLQMYAATNGSFPASRDALVDWSENSRLFRCPATDGPEYVYIPGQTGDMPGTNVLVYEPQAVHDGRCSVLRLGGQIELLTPEELKLAVVATLANLR